MKKRVWFSILLTTANHKILKMKLLKIVFSSLLLISLFFILAFPLQAQEYLGAVLGVKKNGPSSERRVTVGNVEKVTGNTITVQEEKNKKSEVLIDKKTKLIDEKKRVLQLNQIKLKDKVAIISSESGSLASEGGQLRKAARVYVRQATSSAQLKRRAVQGVIENIEGTKITLAHQIQRERKYYLTVSSQTVIKLKGVENGSLSDLQVGQRIAAVGDLTETGSLLAKRIHVIPGKATGVFKKNPLATPSAILSVSPTASATPEISVTPSVTETVTPTESLTP